MMDEALHALTRKYPGLHIRDDHVFDCLILEVRTPDGRMQTWKVDKTYLIQLPTHILFREIVSWLQKINYLDSNGNVNHEGAIFPPQFYNSPPPMPRTNFEGEWDVEVVKPQKKKPVRMGKWGVKLN
jgi:hypothetical protein